MPNTDYTVIGRLDGQEDTLLHVRATSPREALLRAAEEARRELEDATGEIVDPSMDFYAVAVFHGRLNVCAPCEVAPFAPCI